MSSFTFSVTGRLCHPADGGWFGGHMVEFRADGAGKIERRYWSGGSEKPFDPGGRQWLAQTLPKFIRQTGIGAASRVARIMRAKGPGGVLAEISQIQGSWAKRVYFTELLKTEGLDSTTVRAALAQAGKEMNSDFELASLLINSGERLPSDDATGKVYFDAASRIESDFEAASVLMQVAKTHPIEGAIRAPFFRAVDNIGSSFERGRVLQAVVKRPDASADTLMAVLRAANGMGGTFETSQVLLAAAATHPLTGTARDVYIEAAEKLGDFEQGRVLTALVKNERRK